MANVSNDSEPKAADLAILAWLGRRPSFPPELEEHTSAGIECKLDATLGRLSDDEWIVQMESRRWITAKGAVCRRQHGIRSWVISDFSANEDSNVTSRLDEGCSLACVYFGKEQIP